ncbi:MAG: polysaccharide biosynthesis tyrosine autokinase [Bacteroidales bacterium]|nr:polysaccharide biosynthesis tyrosine autokinase [Bacteroidales bacterium]
MKELNNQYFASSEKQEENGKQINYKALLFKLIDKWHIFVITLVVALLVAFFINKYSKPVYQTKASLLIKANDEVLSSIGMKSGNHVNFQNSIGTIQSFTVTKRTLKALELYCDYYKKVNFKYIDIYKENPFEVILDPHQVKQPTGVQIRVKLAANSCYISYDMKRSVPVYDYADDDLSSQRIDIPKREDERLVYDQWYDKDGMRFKIKLKENWNPKYAKIDYAFRINDFNSLASAFNSTKIDLTNKESSIVRIQFKHQNAKKAIDFVNMLCKIFIDQTFEEKNQLQVATIEFVNSQISTIGDSLSKVEAQREAFQLSHNTLSLNSDASYLQQKTNELQARRAEEYTKQQYYNYLADYIERAEFDQGIASPSVMGVSDPILSSQVSSLSQAILEYNTAGEKRTEKNPKMVELQSRIQNLRKQISESLKNVKNVSNINARELQRQQNDLQAKIDRLPAAERNLINIERQFKFNDAIYTFLYQKRADAEIAKNASIPDHKIIDKARAAVQVYPDTTYNYLVALLIGLLLPALYIFVRFITKDTIDDKDDLMNIAQRPVLGYIPEFPKEFSKMIVFDKPNSQIAESYRAVRTNIKYVFNDTDNTQGKVILITSSMPGEGKSLTSFNISSVFSISKNRTIYVEFDLRKPRLHKQLNLNSTIGITTYYIGNTSLEESIQHTEFDNLDALCVGPVPPNPSEIIDSQKTKDLIKTLRTMYDYVILDTPPVNLIADAATLAKEADITLFVVRLGVTSESILKIALPEMENNNGVKVNFIINSIQNVMQKYGYGYGKAYGYGYGYGYGKSYGYGSYVKDYSFGYFDDENQQLKRKKKKESKKDDISED